MTAFDNLCVSFLVFARFLIAFIFVCGYLLSLAECRQPFALVAFSILYVIFALNQIKNKVKLL